MATLAEYGFIGLGILLGAIVGYLLAKSKFAEMAMKAEARLEKEIAASEAKAEVAEESKKSMKAEMESIASQVARQNSEDFLRLAEERLRGVQTEASKDYDARKKEVESLVNPIKEHLEKLEKATNELEKNREGAYQGIAEMVKGLQEQTTTLRDTNIKLSTALRSSSKARGKWGEVSLKNIAEAAGMLQHCDFDVQVSLKSGSGGAIVDLVANIPNGGHVPIDAKVPLAAYWDSLDIEDPEAKNLKLKEHAQQVKKHIDELASRDYPRFLDGTDFTVMFIPAEPILSAAFEIEPTLQEYAFSKHILVVTPVTLLALLRTVGLYWQQQTMAENAKEIHAQSREFYDRVAKFSEDLAKVGRGLSTAVGAFNASIGTFESRILPAGKKIESLKVTEGSQRKLETIEIQNDTVRQLKEVNEDEEN